MTFKAELVGPAVDAGLRWAWLGSQACTPSSGPLLASPCLLPFQNTRGSCLGITWSPTAQNFML